MTILGVGHDVVDVAEFGVQLERPGTRMRDLFSPRELRQAQARSRARHDAEAVHLAARWAGKESVLKAWCQAVGSRPYPFTIDSFPWAQVEILDDSRSRPAVVLGQECITTLRSSVALVGGSGGITSVSYGVRWHISLAHDGPVACAVVLLESVTGLSDG